MQANVIDHIDSGVAIIDVDYNIIMINDYILRMINKNKQEAIGVKCYNLLYNRDSICSDCPNEEVMQAGVERRLSRTVTGPKGQLAYITSHYARLDNYNMVLTLRNTTKEVEIAQNIEKLIKDLQARGVLMEHKHSEMERTLNLADLQLTGVKDGLLVLDQYFRVYTGNTAFCQLLHLKPEEVKGRKCYHLLGRDNYCLGCPVKKQTPNLLEQAFAQEITVNGERLTLREYFSPGPGGGSNLVLTFRPGDEPDMGASTSLGGMSQSSLHQFLKTLSLKMAREDSPEKVLNEAALIIRDISEATEVGIVIGNKRGILEYASFIDVPTYERGKLVIANIKFSRKPDVNRVGDYIIMPIFGRNIPVLGRVFICVDSLPQEKVDLIELILCYLADYMENDQLTRYLDILNQQDFATLTLNRTFFEEIYNKEIAKCTEYNLPLSIVIFQINTFDVIEDLYGEVAATEYFKNVALIIKKNLRDTDYVARYDQNQIIILLPAVSYQGVTVIAERFRELCQGLIITIRDGEGNPHRVKLRISMGYESSERVNILDLVKLSRETLREF